MPAPSGATSLPRRNERPLSQGTLCIPWARLSVIIRSVPIEPAEPHSDQNEVDNHDYVTRFHCQPPSSFLEDSVSAPVGQSSPVPRSPGVDAVPAEIEKIHSLPDNYWPAEWRKHVRALGITSLTLIYWMADKAKGHEFELRITRALDEVGKVFLEMEHSMFD